MARKLPLAALLVRGELAPDTVQAIEAVAQVLYAEPLYFDNVSSKRFGLNWFKIRLWELTEYDAILYVDADVEVHAPSLGAVFDLPTDFAVAMDLNKAGYWYSAMGRGQAGVMMLRPCPAVAAHMLQLASSNRLLQFPLHDAEQDFFDWVVRHKEDACVYIFGYGALPFPHLDRYFKHTRMTLPVEYNTLSEHVVWRLFTGYPHYDALPAPPMSPKQLSVVSTAGGRSGSGGWWGHGRKLLGRSAFDEPEWDLTALTPGGARVIILHHAVESKPWQRRVCQDAREHGIPWPYGLGRD